MPASAATSRLVVIFIGFHNPNFVVKKFVVRSRYFHSWHVTADAVIFGHFAGYSRRLAAAVAGLAFQVVVRRIGIDLLVWIVAGHATDSLVIRVIALAVG